MRVALEKARLCRIGVRYKSLAILRLCLPGQHFTCVGSNEWQRRGFQVRQTDILESTA